LRLLLGWYFVAVWGAGYVATKVGLQYAAPFTFLTLRFCFGLLCLVPVVFFARIKWPESRAELSHLVVAGLLMHVVQLGGSHYAQYLGMSAGVAALIISCQPLLTAATVHLLFKEKIHPGQWLGVFVGHAGVTAATLYQRTFAPKTDLKAAAVIQFGASALVLAPLAILFEGFRVDWSWPLAESIAFLVIFTSLLGVSVLNWLMRHGEATRVAGMMYLPPVFAVILELVLFHVVPSALSFTGMAIACAGVAMTVWPGRWRSSISSR
jgi:drug/metabolite transporter (DMT)-like permease